MLNKLEQPLWNKKRVELRKRARVRRSSCALTTWRGTHELTERATGKGKGGAAIVKATEVVSLDKRAPFARAPSAKEDIGAMRPLVKRRCCRSLVSFLILLPLGQQLYGLMLLHGLFISSTEALISPFNSCHRGEHGLLCNDHSYDVGYTDDVNTTIARATVILSLYIPLVLVPFALLAFLFAVCCEEAGLLWLSVVCQAASSLLTLLGLCMFTTLHRVYVSTDSLTAGFYVCVGGGVELAIAAWLTWMSERKHMMI